ncbi:MAG: hypothetical protein QM820_47150 [Minicystis sp.]
MAHTYYGIDPISTPVANPGFGSWTGGTSTDDGDKRDAASANLNAEAALNRSNWLGWRTINIVDGGTYSYTPGITLANVFTWNGFHTFRNGVTITNAGTFDCDRTANLNGITNFTGAAITRSPGSYLGRPGLNLGSANSTVANAWYYDYLSIPDPPNNLNTGSTGWVYTLTVPAVALSNTVHLLIRRKAAGGADQVIKNADGTQLVRFHENQTSEASVLLRIRAGQLTWEVVHYNGLKRSWFTSGAISTLGEQNWAFY